MTATKKVKARRKLKIVWGVRISEGWYRFYHRKPVKFAGFYGDEYRPFPVTSLCATDFHRLTGIRRKVGEVFKVRLVVVK